MNNLQIFNNEKFGSIRTVEVNNEPYFVGKDVADILGYQNPSKAISMHVDEEDKEFVMMNIDRFPKWESVYRTNKNSSY